MKTLIPNLSETWERVVGVVPIPLDDKSLRWNDDIYSAKLDAPPQIGGTLWVHLSGGKDLAKWSCWLAHRWPEIRDERMGTRETDEVLLMIDRFDDEEAVTTWLERATTFVFQWLEKGFFKNL